MTQFNEEKGYVGIRTIKIFEFQNTRRDFKKNIAVEITEEKEEQYVNKSYMKANHIYQSEAPLFLISQIKQSFIVIF